MYDGQVAIEQLGVHFREQRFVSGMYERFTTITTMAMGFIFTRSCSMTFPIRISVTNGPVRTYLPSRATIAGSRIKEKPNGSGSEFKAIQCERSPKEQYKSTADQGKTRHLVTVLLDSLWEIGLDGWGNTDTMIAINRGLKTSIS